MYARLLNTLKVVNLKTHLKVVWILTFSELILEMIVESNTLKTELFVNLQSAICSTRFTSFITFVYYI